jgi:hypothetical protein
MPRQWCIAHGSSVSSSGFVPLTLRGGRVHTSGPDGVAVLIPVPSTATPAGEKDNHICRECEDLNSKLVGRTGGGCVPRKWRYILCGCEGVFWEGSQGGNGLLCAAAFSFFFFFFAFFFFFFGFFFFSRPGQMFSVPYYFSASVLLFIY